MKVSIDVASLKVIEDNNKPGCSTNIVLTTNGNSGDATLNNNTLNIPTVTLNGLSGITYSSLSATTPLSYNSATGAFSIQQASSTQSGYLSSSNWATFNGKQNALGYTPANKAGDTFTGNISALNLSGTNTGDETSSSILSKIGFTPENLANKATTLSSNDNTHYPTTAAVNMELTGIQTQINTVNSNIQTLQTNTEGLTPSIVQEVIDLANINIGQNTEANSLSVVLASDYPLPGWAIASDNTYVYPESGWEQVITYSGGNISTVTITNPVNQNKYMQTYSYSNGIISNISKWVKQ